MNDPLASIQKIISHEIHPNADNLDIIKVLGWQIVTRRNDFKLNDLVVFCRVDSLLPVKPEFEFLRVSSFRKMHTGEEGFRIKTVKLRQFVSQGIIFPLSILNGLKYENDTRENPIYEFNEGDDVTQLIGVKKWEIYIPECLAGEVWGRRPMWVPQTDEIRVQSAPKVIDEFKGKEVYISTKMDGTSCSIYQYSMTDRNFGVCSRNLDMKESDKLAYWKIAKKYDLENKLKALGQDIVIQGEICGSGIQKNRMDLKELDFFVFDIYNSLTQKYYDLDDMLKTTYKLGLRTVPIDKICTFDFTLEQLLDMAKGKYIGTSNNREGIVIRPTTFCHSDALEGRLSIKVISNEYLLKDEE